MSSGPLAQPGLQLSDRAQWSELPAGRARLPRLESSRGQRLRQARASAEQAAGPAEHHQHRPEQQADECGDEQQRDQDAGGQAKGSALEVVGQGGHPYPRGEGEWRCHGVLRGPWRSGVAARRVPDRQRQAELPARSGRPGGARLRPGPVNGHTGRRCCWRPQ
jgi:hypothetical protein